MKAYGTYFVNDENEPKKYDGMTSLKPIAHVL